MTGYANPDARRFRAQPGASSGVASPGSTSRTCPSLVDAFFTISTLRAFGKSAQSAAVHGASLIRSMYPATSTGRPSFLRMFRAVTASYMVRIGLPRNRGAADIGLSTISEGGLRHNGEKGAFSGESGSPGGFPRGGSGNNRSRRRPGSFFAQILQVRRPPQRGQGQGGDEQDRGDRGRRQERDRRHVRRHRAVHHEREH